MDLLEYQGKQLFARAGVAVPAGEPADSVEDAVAAAERIGFPCVIKAQVLIGGRGKAGGIKLAKDADEARAHAGRRALFGRPLADFQLTQAALADMATALDAALLLTYRAAWLRDTGRAFTGAAAMAKLTATENAQAVIDRALQLFGGRGVVQGEVVERLYREIRALRIYEGASEVQKLVIARELAK